MENSIKEISIDLIDEPKIAMRSDINDEGIDELARSIKEHGLINPITVRPVGDRFEVVAGHRRLTACRRAGIVLISCVVHDIGDKEADIIKAHENLVRQDVNPVDEAVFIGRLISEQGYSVSDIAEMLKRSESWVDVRIEILNMPDYLIDALGRKQIGIGAAIELNKIRDEVTRRNYVEIAAKDGITTQRARAWVDMVAVGAISAETTPEQLQAIESPEQHNQTMISCARCKQGALLKDLVSVWIHRECPGDIPDSPPQSE